MRSERRGFWAVILCFGLFGPGRDARAAPACAALVDSIFRSQGLAARSTLRPVDSREGAAFELLRDRERRDRSAREFRESLYRNPALSAYLAHLHFSPYLKQQAHLDAAAEAKEVKAAVAAYRALAKTAAKRGVAVGVPADAIEGRIIAFLAATEFAPPARAAEFWPLDPAPPADTNEMNVYEAPAKSGQPARRVIVFSRDGVVSRVSVQGARSGGAGGVSSSFRIDPKCRVLELAADPVDFGPSAAGMTLTPKTCAPVSAPRIAAPKTASAAMALLKRIAPEDPDLAEALGNAQDSTQVSVVGKYLEVKRALCLAWVTPPAKGPATHTPVHKKITGAAGAG